MVIAPLIEVSSIGMADSLILLVLALVVFGPRRLPQIGRQMGKLMYEFRKASNDFKFQMEEELRNAEDADRRRQEEERQRTLTLDAPSEPVSATAEVTAMNAVESPYAGETVYPEMETEPAKTEERGLRIQPPSTGETVAAERPGSVSAATSETASEAEAQAEAATEAAAEEQSAPATEAISQNG